MVKTKGIVQVILEYKDGTTSEFEVNNAVLNTGKRALAKSLANVIGNKFTFFISKMLFGDGGTLNGVPRYVDAGRNGLFGLTKATKPVIASLDPNQKALVIFTSVLSYDDANDAPVNEMALQMDNGELYSMVTFADLNKTNLLQITFNWKILVV